MATSYDKKMDIVHELVMTLINGNTIHTYPTYVNMLKRVTKRDIKDYAVQYSFGGYDLSCGLFGTKLEMLKQVAKDKA